MHVLNRKSRDGGISRGGGGGYFCFTGRLVETHIRSIADDDVVFLMTMMYGHSLSIR